MHSPVLEPTLCMELWFMQHRSFYWATNVLIRCDLAMSVQQHCFCIEHEHALYLKRLMHLTLLFLLLFCLKSLLAQMTCHDSA